MIKMKENTMTTTEYATEEASMMASIITMYKDQLSTHTNIPGSNFLTTYSLKKGLQQFGDRGKQATLNEMQQFHDRRCFQPVHKGNLNTTERKQGLESLIFLVEKKRWHSEGTSLRQRQFAT
jgi:hypothetical protein